MAPLAALAPLLMTASPVAAANNIIVAAYFGDCQFAGSNAGSGKTIKIDWRDSDGNLKSKHSVTSNSSGEFVSKCEPGEAIDKGDVLRTTIGTSVRSITVPKVTTTADRYADTVSGKVSPAPATLNVRVFTYNGGFAVADGSWHVASVPPAEGDYTATSWDDSPNIKGWDEVYTEWSDARGDTFVRFVRALGIELWVRQSSFRVVGNPGALVDVGLETYNFELIADVQAQLNRSGSYTGDFVDGDGDSVRIKPGNTLGGTISLGGDQIPGITAFISKFEDSVGVNCHLGAVGVEVVVHTRDYSKVAYRIGWIGPFEFQANFKTNPSFDIVSGTKIDVYCKFATGDIQAQTFTA